MLQYRVLFIQLLTRWNLKHSLPWDFGWSLLSCWWSFSATKVSWQCFERLSFLTDPGEFERSRELSFRIRRVWHSFDEYQIACPATDRKKYVRDIEHNLTWKTKRNTICFQLSNEKRIFTLESFALAAKESYFAKHYKMASMFKE